MALLAAFIALVLNVFGNVTRSWCNTTLRLLAILLGLAFSKDGDPTVREQNLLDNFPRDIRTVRKVFDLEAKTTIYATCPQCLCTYAPEVRGKVNVYPARCSWQRFPTSNECGARLTKRKVVDGCSVREPIRPFVVQDFDEFKAAMLTRPGMEDLLDKGTVFNDQSELWDIKDGYGIRDLPGPDGKPFIDGLKRDELRTAWSISVDWFNPFMNKAAGKSASTGSIVMACLNLPPSLRYKPENLFLVGVIPGPKEPSLDEINHFMRPLVDNLLPSWEHGTWFSSTHRHPQGRRERSAIAVVVTDLPAARKVTGLASYAFKKHFCSLCLLSKPDINNINHLQWARRTQEAHLEAAESWRDAQSKAERTRIFKEHGIRWSELLRLKYFDPTKMVVVDSMHNLFLGLVQFHFREVLAIDNSTSGAGAKGEWPVKEKALAKGRVAMSKSTPGALGRLTVPVLKALCVERGIDPQNGKTEAVRKADLVQALLVRQKTLIYCE